MTIDINKVLLLGGGPTNIGHENELDAAAFERLMALKKTGAKIIYVDNNPFSVTTEEIQPANVYVQEANFQNIVNIMAKTVENRWSIAMMVAVFYFLFLFK